MELTQQQLIQLLLANNMAPDIIGRPGEQNITQQNLLGMRRPNTAADLIGSWTGIGKQGGGALGKMFGGLFGNKEGAVSLGGGNQFTPGVGFQQQAQGPIAQNGSAPMAKGLDFSSLLSSLFGA